jgi:hypothetical protein
MDLNGDGPHKCLKFGARDRDRTGTPLLEYGILSPGRLPIPPLGHGRILALVAYSRNNAACGECLSPCRQWLSGRFAV